jgi:hypothetical protein
LGETHIRSVVIFGMTEQGGEAHVKCRGLD